MKKVYIVIGLVILALLSFEFLGPDSGNALSEAQNQIRNTLGAPSSFVLQYIPRGEDGNELVRYETWFYPSHGRSVTFYAGDIVSSDEMSDADPKETDYSPLLPWDLDVTSTYQSIEELVRGAKIEKVDFLPELFVEGDVETYMTDHLIFTLEGGSFVYAQTIGTNK